MKGLSEQKPHVILEIPGSWDCTGKAFLGTEAASHNEQSRTDRNVMTIKGT